MHSPRPLLWLCSITKKLNIPTKKNVYSNVIQDNLKLGEGFKFANKRLGKFTKWNAAQ